MTKSKIAFATLRQFLLDMGFSETVVPNSHIAFLHADSGTEIMLPNYRSNQNAAPRHLLATRVMLDVKGVLDSNKFDDFVESHSERQSVS